MSTVFDPAYEKAELVRDIRSRLPYVAVGHPDLARQIGRAMDLVEAEAPTLPVEMPVEIADTAAYLWGLVLAHHSADHGAPPKRCGHWFCSTIRYAVIKERDALVRAGYPDPMVENFKPQHRP
jgi:hypothetical protein